MAQYTINIEDDELEELQGIVAGIQREQPQLGMTEQQYAENIVRGFLRTRIKNQYVGYVQQQNIADLKTKLGTVQDIRSAQNVKQLSNQLR